MSSPLPPSDTDSAAQPAKRWPKSRRFLIAVSIILIVAALVVVLLPKAAPPPIAKVYTPQQTAAVDRKFADIQHSLVAPPPVQSPKNFVGKQNSPETTGSPDTPSNINQIVTIQLSEADINAYIATNPAVKAALSRRGIRAVEILLREPHNVIIRANILYHGRAENLQIAGSLLPSAKTMMRLDVASAQIGRVPIPADTATATANKLLLKATGPVDHRFPLTVNSVHVRNHNLILSGLRRLEQTEARA